MKNIVRFVALAVVMAVGASILTPMASAVAPIREADVVEQFTPAANNPAHWEEGALECVKFESDPNGGSWGTEWVANGDYALVVIKSAQKNGIFDTVQAGERLGSPSFNGGGNRQDISHIIACYGLVCETTGGVSAPSISHALVLFGGSGVDYKSANHTFGGFGTNGLAINGSAQFPNYSTSFNAGGAVNYITDGYSGMRPTANGGSWATTGFPYSQQAWIDYAAALADAAEADPGAYPNVNVYRTNGGSVTLTNDGGDYPSASTQKLHVVVGTGTVYTTQGQNDKTDGAILAPQAKVDVDKRIHHVHGFVVAAQFIESFAGSNLNNTGLQVHGQIPAALVDVPGDENCVPPTTLPPTTTTVAPIPAVGSLTLECVVDTTYKGAVSVTAGNEVDENGKLHWKVAVVGEGRLFDGRLDPFDTFSAERELDLTPGATVILAQKASVTGTEVILAEAVVPPACPVPVWEGQILDLAVECDSNVTFTVENSGNQDFQYRYYIDTDLQGSANVPAGGTIDVVIPAGDLEAGETITVILLGYSGHVVTPAQQVVYPEPCFVADPAGALDYSTGCDAGIGFTMNNTGNVALTAKLYRDGVLLMSPELPAGTNSGWQLNHGLQITDEGQTARVELYYEDVLIATTGDVVYAGSCFVPAPAGTVQLATECDAPIEGSVVNTGNVDLTFIVTTDGMSTPRLDLLVGETRTTGMATPVEGSSVKIELFDGDTLIDSAEIVHPGECPQPEGDLAIECVVNTDYRITGSVTAADKVAPDGVFYAYVAVDGVSDDRLFTVGTAPFETKEFARTRTLTPGATLVLSQGPWVEGGIQAIASVTVPESCPVAPSGDLSIECVVDDLYDVDAFIDGGSTGVNWLLRIRGGGGIVTQGFVPAFDAETVTLTEAQFDEGLVLVLRAPQNGGKLDSVSVPAPCFAPVSDAETEINVTSECDGDVFGSAVNTGETTVYANVYINDELYFDVDTVIEIGQTFEFSIPASVLDTDDYVEVVAWDLDGELIMASGITYPEPCPPTTTVPPTTVPPTTTVPVPECLGPDDVDPRPQPGPGEPALPAIPQCETPDYTG